MPTPQKGNICIKILNNGTLADLSNDNWKTWSAVVDKVKECSTSATMVSGSNLSDTFYFLFT